MNPLDEKHINKVRVYHGGTPENSNNRCIPDRRTLASGKCITENTGIIIKIYFAAN